MALFNYATKEITLKIVYYGPGLSGKTTNLQQIHSVLSPSTKGKLLSLATEADRTLFFDFLPVELGKIRDFSIRFQLYTVPGQVRYNATRKVVLKGADAVVFVADSQAAMRDQNIESLENMRDNLRANNINPEAIPVLLQFNKRDLPSAMPVDEMNADLNPDGVCDHIESTAIKGDGVEETFRLITKLLLKDIAKKHRIEVQNAGEEEKPKSAEPLPQAETEKAAEEQAPEAEAALAIVSEDEPAAEEAAEVFAESVPEDAGDTLEVLALPEEEPAASGQQVPEERPAPEFVMPTEEPVLMKKAEDIFPDLKKEEPAMAEAKPKPERTGRVSFRETIAETMPKPRPERTPPPLPPRPLFEQVPQKPVAEALKETVPGTQVPPKEPPVSRATHASEPVATDKASFDFAKVASSVDRIEKVASEIRMAITSMKADLASIKAEVAALKSDVASLRQPSMVESVPPPPPIDPKAIKEILREQAEIISALREISQILGTLQEKKSWFKF